MNLKGLLVALLATSVGFVAQAETTTAGETKVQVEGQNTVEGNLDNEITNARMRAESGSKSKLSMSIDVNYSGGSIEEPFDHERADLLGGASRPAVKLNTDIGVRYRLSKNTSVSAGAGVTLIQPFHSADKNPEYSNYEDKFEPTSPSVNLSTYRKVNNWMVSGSVAGTAYTEDRFTDSGYIADIYASGTGLYDFKNNFQVGLNAGVGSNILESGSNGEDLYFSVNPFAEYVLNDTFNLRTVFNFGLNHYKNELADGSHWDNSLTRQSFGFGVAATRDIFLYPNVQISTRDFYAEASFENSTFGFSATINAF